MPFNTVNILDRIWKKCLTDKGVTIQLRPEDNLKLLVTRLRRRHTALKKHYGEAATGRALQLYHIEVDTELLQLRLEFVDLPQDTLAYLVRELGLKGVDKVESLEYSHAPGSSLDGLFVTFPTTPDNDAKVFPLNGL
jgi:hypothetical protein